MSNIKYKICCSGLEKVEANFIKVWVSKKEYVEFLEDSFILPKQCTHLVTKTAPELKKTEKILCALARGIPILDYKHINKIISSSNADTWNEEEYDIGGKDKTYQVLLSKWGHRFFSKIIPYLALNSR